jgi:guanyl-specific ribonuclease Sa
VKLVVIMASTKSDLEERIQAVEAKVASLEAASTFSPPQEGAKFYLYWKQGCFFKQTTDSAKFGEFKENLPKNDLAILEVLGTTPTLKGTVARLAFQELFKKYMEVA